MRYCVPANVAYIDGAEVDLGQVLYLTILPYGQSVCLEGIGRLIWTQAASGDDPVTGIASLVGKPVDSIEQDVADFLEDLLRRGLLAKS